MGDFGPQFLVRFLIIIWGKMSYFKGLDDKGIIKLKNG